jgi:HSP20 family molecular chaperone IbpA
MYDDLQDMFQEMDELYTRLFARMTSNFATGDSNASVYYRVIRQEGQLPVIPGSQRDQLRASSDPIVEIHRIGDEVKVITELPGMTMDAIELKLLGSTLTIDAKEGSSQYHAHADLPPVDSGPMQTSFKNGVLEVTLKRLPDYSEEESY